MLVSDAVRCAGHVLMGLVLLGDDPSPVALVALSAVVGAAGGFFRPASSSLVPNAVAAERLQQANALLAVSRRTAMLAGPALATTLALTVGAGWAMILDGATFAVSCLTLSRLDIPRTQGSRGSFLRDLHEGWNEVRERRWLWSNLAAMPNLSTALRTSRPLSTTWRRPELEPVALRCLRARPSEGGRSGAGVGPASAVAPVC